MSAKKVTIRILQTLIILFAILNYHSGFTAGIETSERINNAARTFIMNNIQSAPGETIEVKVNQANIPLRVSACSKDIEAAFPANSNREQLSAVALSCNDSQPWHVLVPVDVQVYSKVIVAKRTISAKQVITEEDIDFTAYNKNQLYNGFFIKKEEVLGNESSHIITAGTILTRKNIQLPLLVHRNQMINLISQSNSIIVTMQGIAKSDGSLNSIIKVFNPSSKKTLDAIVVGPNKAQVSA